MYISTEFREKLAARRGRRPWLHLDSKGVVTIGVGHAVPDLEAALRLPLRDPATGERAGEDAVRAAWERLQRHRQDGQYGREFLPEFYREEGGPTLLDADIDLLVQADLDAVAAAVGRTLPAFDGCPPSAKEALVEMALRHGEGFLLEERWAGLRAAIADGDFALAAVRAGGDRDPWPAARFERAARERALELSIEEKMGALVQSLTLLADTAKTELKKIEVQVGALAEGLVDKAKEFLGELTERAQAAADAAEARAAEARAQRARAQADKGGDATRGEAPEAPLTGPSPGDPPAQA